MPVIVIGIWVLLVNKTIIIALMELTFSQERQKMYNPHMDMDKLSSILEGVMSYEKES